MCIVSVFRWLTLCFNSLKGHHSSDWRLIKESPVAVVNVNSDCSWPLLVKAETRPSFLGLEGWIVHEMNRLHILMLWEKVYSTKEKETETERMKKHLHQTHHLSCDSLPGDITLLLCVAALYLCVCSCTLFCTCLKAHVASVCVFWLHTAIIKITPAQATFFKFVWRI